jgi:phage-related protein
MTRHLSVASAIDKNKLTSAAVWVAILEIQVVDPNTRGVTETLYLARNDEPLIFNGEEYLAANFDFDIQQQSGQDPSVTLTANDQTRYIASRMEAMAGGVFSQVTLRIVNSERLDQPAELEYDFEIVGSSVANYVVSFTLGAENFLNVAFPRHRQWKDRCAWRYKGYGCFYAGGLPSCDYTLDGPNGCAVHFPSQPSLPFKGLPGLVRLNI